MHLSTEFGILHTALTRSNLVVAQLLVLNNAYSYENRFLVGHIAEVGRGVQRQLSCVSKLLEPSSLICS